MPSLDEMRKLLADWNYSLAPHAVMADHLYGELRGGELKVISARIRATNAMCTVAVFVGVIEAVPDRHRGAICEDLLVLNYDHPLAKVGMFRAKEPEPLGVFVVESSFLTTEPTRAKFDLRMQALYALSKAVSLSLASKQALVSFNPFYQEIRSAPPPVERPAQ